ncbi:hypothetical protein GCM10010211_58950 [Streptomyces albospinus]|uniref:Uncharacterized protein n=1 Tax=Streptomyces albospinus TaxID=285515 RepID=A0ABQ2VJE7_9ACTN|nr:hypothetical protein GCM10010211_58950 [Streptomyces albospinus]
MDAGVAAVGGVLLQGVQDAPGQAAPAVRGAGPDPFEFGGIRVVAAEGAAGDRRGAAVIESPPWPVAARDGVRALRRKGGYGTGKAEKRVRGSGRDNGTERGEGCALRGRGV